MAFMPERISPGSASSARRLWDERLASRRCDHEFHFAWTHAGGKPAPPAPTTPHSAVLASITRVTVHDTARIQDMSLPQAVPGRRLTAPLAAQNSNPRLQAHRRANEAPPAPVFPRRLRPVVCWAVQRGRVEIAGGCSVSRMPNHGRWKVQRAGDRFNPPPTSGMLPPPQGRLPDTVSLPTTTATRWAQRIRQLQHKQHLGGATW